VIRDVSDRVSIYKLRFDSGKKKHKKHGKH
jgi:hypothetical protein